MIYSGILSTSQMRALARFMLLMFCAILVERIFYVLKASLQRAGSCLDKCNINAKYCDFA